MKCLIVEDNQIASKVLNHMMSKFATCDAAVNGQEAVDLFQQAHESNSPYDLILMDIMMPEIDGLRSVRLIREKEATMNIPLKQRVKVIMTTALDDPRTVIKALYESDANSFLKKPITLPILADELRTLNLIAP
jgi:two-component system chemotaxis response regulator CheY